MKFVIAILLMVMGVSANAASDAHLTYVACQSVQKDLLTQTPISLPGKDADSRLRICSETMTISRDTSRPQDAGAYQIEILRDDGNYEMCFAEFTGDLQYNFSVTWNGCMPPPHPQLPPTM